LFARFQALLLRFVEHCSWEVALPKLQDPDRLPDPSTVRRWWSDLDCSQLVPSFFSQTVAGVAHGKPLRNPDVPQPTPLSWITPVLQNLWPLRL
jgi:hypothetical protein